MAKTSMVEREKRRAKTVKKYAAKRAQLKEQIRSPRTSPAQSLRDHWPLARRVSQVRTVAREDPRDHQSRRDSGPVQGELVRAAV
jgi:hypothetical protein